MEIEVLNVGRWALCGLALPASSWTGFLLSHVPESLAVHFLGCATLTSVFAQAVLVRGYLCRGSLLGPCCPQQS